MSEIVLTDAPPPTAPLNELRALLDRMDAAVQDLATKESNKAILHDCAVWLVTMAREVVRLQTLNRELTAARSLDTE